MKLPRNYIPAFIPLSLILTTPALGSGQDRRTIESGDRVRVTAPCRGLDKTVGTIQEATGDALVLQLAESSTTVARSEITALDVSRGLRNQAAMGASLGVLAGIVVAVVRIGEGEDDPQGSAFPTFPRSSVVENVQTVILASMIGAAVGGVIGLLIPRNPWEPLEVNDFQLAILPVVNREGVGFGFRLESN